MSKDYWPKEPKYNEIECFAFVVFGLFMVFATVVLFLLF